MIDVVTLALAKKYTDEHPGHISIPSMKLVEGGHALIEWDGVVDSHPTITVTTGDNVSTLCKVSDITIHDSKAWNSLFITKITNGVSETKLGSEFFSEGGDAADGAFSHKGMPNSLLGAVSADEAGEYDNITIGDYEVTVSVPEAGTYLYYDNNSYISKVDDGTITGGRIEQEGEDITEATAEVLSEYLGSPWENGTGTHSAQTKGNNNNAIGISSVSEGAETDAHAYASHAEGYMTSTGVAADYSHTEGYKTSTQGQASHAEGDNTITNNAAEHAEGRYNKSNMGGTPATNTLHSVGIGNASGSIPGGERKNAFEIMENGDAYLVGVGGFEGDNVDEANTLQNEISDIKGYIGYTENDIYGVEVDYVNNIFTRLAGAIGKTSGSDFNNIQAFGGRKRCNLTDDGVVVAYYGDDAYTETGKLTVAVTIDETTYPIGTIVQVMVEQPKFYYKVVPLKLEKNIAGKGFHIRKARYYISDTMKEGFKLHPAFICDNKENDKIYLAAYEACTWDTSASNYNITDAQTVDWTNDKLASIANAKPTSGLTQTGATRAGFRTIAKKRGSGWTQSTIQTISATMILFLIEYASLNTQSCIGNGVVNKTDDGSTNMSELTGATSLLGNTSGSVINENNYNVPSYRGEENWWGNIWKWIDGINLKNDDGSVKIADHNFTDNSESSPYIDAGITYPAANGYIKAFGYDERFDWLFITSEVGGNSSVPVGDYFYQDRQNKVWRVAILGGRWSSGSYAGGFYWTLDSGSSGRSRSIGGRVVYTPTRTN